MFSTLLQTKILNVFVYFVLHPGQILPRSECNATPGHYSWGRKGKEGRQGNWTFPWKNCECKKRTITFYSHLILIPGTTFSLKMKHVNLITSTSLPPTRNGNATGGREGVQSSSNSNHRHPNLFRGKRAPQLVISTTSNSNHCKILFYVI